MAVFKIYICGFGAACHQQARDVREYQETDKHADFGLFVGLPSSPFRAVQLTCLSSNVASDMYILLVCVCVCVYKHCLPLAAETSEEEKFPIIFTLFLFPLLYCKTPQIRAIKPSQCKIQSCGVSQDNVLIFRILLCLWSLHCIHA